MRTTRSAGFGRGSEHPELRLTEPADVVAAVPYLVGYHPADSVVLLALRGRSLAFSVRADLPDAAGSEPELDAVVAQLLDLVRRRHITGAVLVGYGSAELVDPVLRALDRCLTGTGIVVLEALRCADGRYWSYRCADPGCCPPEGIPFDASTSAVAATATLAGRAVLPDRAAFEALVAPVGGLSRLSVRQATQRAGDRLVELITRAADEAAASRLMLHEGRAAIEAAIVRYTDGGRLDDDEVAWLSLLLVSTSVRDLACERITGPVDVLQLHSDLWLDVMRRVEPDLVPGPGSLFAFAAWCLGDGPLARLAVARVLDEDPTYAMAIHLEDAIDQHLPPSALAGFPYGSVTPRRARRRRRRSSSRRAGTRPE